MGVSKGFSREKKKKKVKRTSLSDGLKGRFTLDTSARRITFLITSLVCFSVHVFEAAEDDIFFSVTREVSLK